LEEKNRKPVVMLDAVFLGQQLMVVAPRCLSLSLTLVVGQTDEEKPSLKIRLQMAPKTSDKIIRFH
jgi:hypothetical protein